MPSESTLRAWSSKIEIMPGFLSISFTQIKSYQKKSEKQRVNSFYEKHPGNGEGIINWGNPKNEVLFNI
ncbi:unnamed protein product [Gordionus sp. m RMFG-2023]